LYAHELLRGIGCASIAFVALALIAVISALRLSKTQSPIEIATPRSDRDER